MKLVAYHGPLDTPRMLALAQASSASNTHVVDWPYRFASWSFDQPENIALWTDDTGALVAWAVLQTPFWALDYVMHPSAESSTLHRDILAWADTRANTALGTRFGRPAWFVNVMSHQEERMRDLQAMGFANQADVGEDAWSKVLMSLSLKPDALPAVTSTLLLPEGFEIRPLAGEREVEAYVALHRAVFESENMTVGWRMRMLTQPAYHSELNLVAAAPDRSLCGFCVCWLDGAVGQVEPMGIRSDMRRRHLGRILLDEGIRRLRTSGATRVYVETDNYRNAAFALYSSCGFAIEHDVLVFRKDYA